MQSVQSLSFEAIPSRFCESGDHQAIEATGPFSYVSGLAAAFSATSFVQRTHVNAIGRLGTTAQALNQAGFLVSYCPQVTYGINAVVTQYDGFTVRTWRSTADSNNTAPVGADGNSLFAIVDNTDIADWDPLGVSSSWANTCPNVAAGFFDVN